MLLARTLLLTVYTVLVLGVSCNADQANLLNHDEAVTVDQARALLKGIESGTLTSYQLSPQGGQFLSSSAIATINASYPNLSNAELHFVVSQSGNGMMYSVFNVTADHDALRLSLGINSQDQISWFSLSEIKPPIAYLSKETAPSPMIRDIISRPDSWDHQLISEAGIVVQYFERTSRSGATYTTFLICRDDCLQVFQNGHPGLNEGDHVVVRGIFQKDVPIGDNFIHDEIIASMIGRVDL